MNELAHHDLTSFPSLMVQGLQSMRALELMTLPDHADKYFFLPPGSSGIPGPWQTAPFQRGLMLVISNDQGRRVVIQKPARVGYTKILAASLSYFAERKRRSTCLWQPTDTDVKEFVQDEVEPLFEYVPTFADALLSDPTRAKDPRNTLSRKEFRGATLHFKGGKSASNYRRMTLDVAMLDELDGFDRNIRGSEGKAEGSPVTLAEVRITDSPYGRMIIGSTPTVRGASLIESELQACEVVLERYSRCPFCGEAQVLKWGDKNVPWGMKWDHGDPKSARYVCNSCGGRMEWGDINLIDSGGFWASDTVWLDDSGDGEFRYRSDDSIAPFPEIIGFTFSTLVSPFYSWTQLVKSYLEAVREAQMGDRMKLNTWINTRLGQTYTEHEMVLHDPIKLMERCEVYTHKVPLGVVCITAGVDVQIDRFEIEFRGWGAGEESWGLQYVKIIGDTSKVPEYDDEGNRVDSAGSTVYDDLNKLLQRTFEHPVYGPLQAAVCCIDSGYQTTNIYEFCRQNPRLYIPVKGAGNSSGRRIVEFSASGSKNGVFLGIIGSDDAMNTIHERLAITEPGAGCYHWPKEDYGFNQQYFTQLLAEQRVKKIRNGRPVLTWVCPPNVRNEPADTAKYNLAAIKLAQHEKGVVLHAPTSKPMELTPLNQTQSREDRIREIAKKMNRPRD